MSSPHINVDQVKQQQQMMAMRAQQMANDTQRLDFQGKKGTNKQLIGTVAGIAGFVIVLFLLSYFKII